MTQALSGQIHSFDIRGMRSNNSGTANRKLSHVLRANALRRVEPGYPKIEPFASLEAISAYFDCEELTCLRCGQQKRSLGLHLRVIHGWTPEEYKEFYNLPWRRGLVGKSTKEAKRLNGIANYQNGIGLAALSEQDLHAARAKAHATAHRKSMVHSLHAASNAVAMNGGIQYTASDFEAVLAKMRDEDLCVGEVCAMEDMPGRSWISAYVAESPNDRRRLSEAARALSAAAKARSRRLDDVFSDEAKRLRAQGLSYHKVAEALGVSAMAVHRHLNVA